LENILESIPKTDGTPYEKYELWHKIYMERQSAYKNKKFSNSKKVLEKLTREGEFKSIYLTPKILFKKDFSDYPWKKQKPTHGKLSIDPFRACALLIKMVNEDNPFEISYNQEEKISFVDITSNIFKDIARSPCTIPSDWYVFGQISGIDIIKSSIIFEENFDESLFNYTPPIVFEQEEYDMISVSKEKSVYWDNGFGIPFSLDDNELFLINCCDWTKDDLLSSKLKIPFEEYKIECLCRNAFENTEDDLMFQEDEKILESLEGSNLEIDHSILIKKEDLSRLANTGLTFDINDLLDMDDDYSSEEEEQEPELDEHMLLLRSLGIDSIDLFGMDGVNDYYSDEEGYE
jgi:hypothetical protein